MAAHSGSVASETENTEEGADEDDGDMDKENGDLNDDDDEAAGPGRGKGKGKNTQSATPGPGSRFAKYAAKGTTATSNGTKIKYTPLEQQVRPRRFVDGPLAHCSSTSSFW